MGKKFPNLFIFIGKTQILKKCTKIVKNLSLKHVKYLIKFQGVKMLFKDIARILKEVPYMSNLEGKVVYDFIRRSGFQNILELGFAHGTSTCYFAAAIEENGSGLITTMDNQLAKDRKPNIFALLNKTKLSRYVKPIFADSSYTWELMKIIENQTIRGVCKPQFDFCFLDGAHTWEVDGLTFFLVEKLLKPGGWILFDDLEWSFAQSPSLQNSKVVQKMPEDQKTTPQVKKVFSLLVCQHQNFENIKIFNDWGWAQKRTRTKNESTMKSQKIINKMYSRQIFKSNIDKIFKKIKRFLKS